MQCIFDGHVDTHAHLGPRVGRRVGDRSDDAMMSPHDSSVRKDDVHEPFGLIDHLMHDGVPIIFKKKVALVLQLTGKCSALFLIDLSFLYSLSLSLFSPCCGSEEKIRGSIIGKMRGGAFFPSLPIADGESV